MALQAARLPHGAVTGREPPTPSSRTGTRGHAALPALLRRAKFWGEVLSPPTPLRSPSLPAGPGRTLNAAPMLGAQPGSALGVPAPRGAAVGGCPQGDPRRWGWGPAWRWHTDGQCSHSTGCSAPKVPPMSPFCHSGHLPAQPDPPSPPRLCPGPPAPHTSQAPPHSLSPQPNGGSWGTRWGQGEGLL